MMKCGHVANGIDKMGNPVCLICISDLKEAKIIDNSPLPDLTGRQAKCLDCGKIVESSLGLVFFDYRPKHAFDSFYCGCKGWE